MKSLFSKLLLMTLIFSLVVPQSLRAAPDDEEEDLSTAFEALTQSMGSNQHTVESAKIDKALEEAFSPVPGIVANSDMDLDDPKTKSPEAVKEAVNSLAAMDIEIPVANTGPVINAPAPYTPKNKKSRDKVEKKAAPVSYGPIDTEYIQRGLGLSMTLWSGGQETMKAVLTNIIKQIYSDKDVRNFRFIVNSSPLPSVDINIVDLDAGHRARLEAKEKGKEESWSGKFTEYKAQKVDVPVRMGAEIKISAGLLATVRTVDELAGQLAKALATKNPALYGWKEDTRFTRNQEYLELINQIIEASSEETKKSITEKRDEVIAELSAMERLAAGGFHPSAIQRYERRVLTWMGDVYAKSPNHSLSRFFFDLGRYRFDDPSRSLRILLQTSYMKFLQNQERGRGMATQETEFSSRMKFLRLRMKLFTEPFYLGLPFQLAPIALAGGVAVSGIFDTHVSHWALSAFYQTGGPLSALWHGTAHQIGSLVQKVPMSGSDILNTGFFGARTDAAKKATNEVVAIFYQSYRTALYIGAAAIAAGALRYFRENIANVVEDASRIMRLRENQRKINAPVPEMEVKSLAEVDKIYEDEQKQLDQERKNYESLPEPERLEVTKEKVTKIKIDRRKSLQEWLSKLLQFRKGLMNFFASLGARGEMKAGQILVEVPEAKKEGAVVATEIRLPRLVQLPPAPSYPEDSLPEEESSPVRPSLTERLWNWVTKAPSTVQNQGTEWSDRFDEWLIKFDERVHSVGNTGVQIAVRARVRSTNSFIRVGDLLRNAAVVVFVDIPVGVKRISLRNISAAMKVIDDRREQYRVWREGAPERARIRQEKRMEEQRKAEEKRIERERAAEKKREEKERAAQLKRANAQIAAEQQRIKAEKDRAEAREKFDQAFWARMEREEQIAQRKRDAVRQAEQQKALERERFDQAFWARMDKEEKIAQQKREAIQEAKRKKEADQVAFQKEQARKARLAEGIKRRQELLLNENVTPAEISGVLSSLAGILEHLFYKLGGNSNLPALDYNAAEKWGIDTAQKYKKDIKSAFEDTKAFSSQLLTKWVKQARKLGTTESEAKYAIRFMDNVYKQQSYQQNTKSRFFDLALPVYEILLEKISPEERSNVTNMNLVNWAANDQPFIQDLEVERQSRVARSTKSGAKKGMAIVNSSERARKNKIREFYSGNEREIVEWLSSPETKAADIRKFFGQLITAFRGTGDIPMIGYRHRFRAALATLSPIKKLKIYFTAEDLLADKVSVANRGAIKDLKATPAALVRQWITQSASIRDLIQHIESDCGPYGIAPERFNNLLRDAVLKRPALFVNESDVRLYAEKEYFWPTSNSENESTILEKPLVELLAAKRKQFGDSPAWKYDPIWSERMHKVLRDRLVALGQFPTRFEDLEATWKLWTSRGVSTITDEILGELLKKGTPEQIDHLEIYAVKEGRVFDQGLRDEFAIRQIVRSPEYAALMKPRAVQTENGTEVLPALSSMPGTDRKEAIRDVVRVAQEFMQDLGVRYGQFLEDLSKEIQSTHEEAQFIHEAKAKRIVDSFKSAVDAYSDSRIKMLKDILPYVKSWKPENQYKFLLYLRGSIDSKDFKFIEAQFPAFGPERIRKIYQGLPIEAAIAVTHLYLQETLLSRGEVDQGYGKKLIKYLVSAGTDEQTRTHAAELLDALLYGVDKSGSKEFQMSVLSALIAMKTDQKASIGETIKLILEQFPGVGPKIGQFLVATGLLSDDINEVVKETQDKTLPPKRIDMFSDLFDIAGEGRDLGIHVEDLLGSGSLKYTLKAKELKTQKQLALQVFRQDVQNNADLQISILNYAIDRLVEKDRRNSFLRVIVDGAMSAVAREKRFDLEADKTKFAKNNLYSTFNDSEFDVSVPVQALLNKRLLQARFAKGVSFKQLSDQDKLKVGLKILDMESKILFSDHPDQNGQIWYDTDRHAGNYVIEVIQEGGQKRYKIAPIDFGQLTSIKREQRDKISEMFAYAAMLETFGANEWLTQEVAKLFNITGPDYKPFEENLYAFFPGGEGPGSSSKGSTVKSYFSLIAAINEALRSNDKKVEKGKLRKEALSRTGELKEGKLDLAYTDFVRAIIQLNQYEEAIEKISGIPSDATTPRKIMESKAKDILADRLQKIELSFKQRLYIKYVDMKGQLQAKLTGKTYEPINIRKTRADLDKYSIFSRQKPTVVEGTSQASPPVQVQAQVQVQPQRQTVGVCRALLGEIAHRLPFSKSGRSP